MMVPEDVLHRATIIYKNYDNFPREVFQMLGIRSDQVVLFNEMGWVSAHIVYTLVPAPHISFFGKPMKDLSYKLKRAANVSDTIEPTGFYLMNRKTNRCFTKEAMTEILNYLKLNYKEYTWEIYQDSIRDVKNLIILWNNVKFAFTPTGSNLMGVLFIQKDSVVVCALCNFRDLAFTNIAITFGARFIMFSNPSPHFSRKKYMNLNINCSKEMIDIGMFAVKYKKWPKQIDNKQKHV
jgi:hypothetical protein